MEKVGLTIFIDCSSGAAASVAFFFVCLLFVYEERVNKSEPFSLSILSTLCLVETNECQIRRERKSRDETFIKD